MLVLGLEGQVLGLVALMLVNNTAINVFQLRNPISNSNCGYIQRKSSNTCYTQILAYEQFRFYNSATSSTIKA